MTGIRLSAARSAMARWIRPALRALSILSLVYVGYLFVGHLPEILTWRPGVWTITAVAGLAVIYGAALFLLAENWHLLVRANSDTGIARRRTYPSHTGTQLAKYLPGNVGHLVGRHLWLSQDVISQRALLATLFWETAALIAGAIAITAFVLAVTPAPGSPPAAFVWRFGLPICAALAAGAVTLAALSLREGPRQRAAGAAIRSLALTTGFFAVQGLIFLAVCKTVADQSDPALIGISVAAWLAGFLVPGAPGGLGPRELVLVLLIGTLMAEPDALLAIAVFRLVTMTGDVVCFVLGRVLFGSASAPSGP